MEQLTEKELVSFGNYLLSNDRRKRTSKENKESVTHADLENWRELAKTKGGE